MKTIGKCAILLELSRIQVFVFFIFDKSDDFPSKLEQEGFSGRDVDHGELDTANVGASHCDLLHVVNSTDPFNERRDLISIFLDDAPVDLVSLLIHFCGRF